MPLHATAIQSSALTVDALVQHGTFNDNTDSDYGWGFEVSIDLSLAEVSTCTQVAISGYRQYNEGNIQIAQAVNVIK
jgi:hypothetical protein